MKLRNKICKHHHIALVRQLKYTKNFPYNKMTKFIKKMLIYNNK